MNEIRLRRVENLIRDKLSILIMHEIIKDKRIDKSITITHVKAAKDLSSARIWVSSFGGQQATNRTVKALIHAAGFIQSRIGREMRMRKTPKLYFKADDSIREGMEVNRLISHVMEEQSING